MSAHSIVELLRGGDRRSIDGVARVLDLVRAAPSRVEELLSALGSTDPVVALRAADALEKLGREHAGWLAPHRARLLRIATRTSDPGVRWNLVLLLPALTRTSHARRRLADRLVGWYREDPSVFVRASALEALTHLVATDERMRPMADALLREALEDASPALRARARRLTRGGRGDRRTERGTTARRT